MSDPSIEQVKADLVLLSTVDLPRIINLGTELVDAILNCQLTTARIVAGSSNPLLEKLVGELRAGYAANGDGLRELDKALRTAEEALGTL